jgi:microsomal dipeptidase-like Zn-dependent dipeptidase
VGIGIDTMFSQEGIDDMPRDIDQELWWPKAHYGVGVGGLGYLLPEVLPQIVEGLLARGLDDLEMRQIMGLNMLRVAESTWG